jgi:TonB-dependent starch-binding outer membrane protein SusC
VPTIDYLRMAQGGDHGHADYLLRWQQTGDEAHTSVPSMPSVGFPLPLRDQFNTNAAIRIQKADFIQLQQVQIGYDAIPQFLKGTPVMAARLFVQLTNLGNLYQSASHTIDPEMITGMPAPRTCTIGLRVDLK